MPKRNILILDQESSPWHEFLEEFFEDTPSVLFRAENASDLHAVMEKHALDMAFINSSHPNLAVTQKIKVHQQSAPDFCLFNIGASAPATKDITFQGSFEGPGTLLNFQKELVSKLSLPEVIKVLIVDDEPDIGGALRDYLEGRSHPIFDVEYVDNGRKGMDAIKKRTPDVLILDVKMPVMTGLEVYREIQRKGLDIAVIVFFDAITGNEITELHKWGRPSIVDKGAGQDAMPQMISLIKKMYYFA